MAKRYEKLETQQKIWNVFGNVLAEKGLKAGEGGWTEVEGGGGRSVEDVEKVSGRQ